MKFQVALVFVVTYIIVTLADDAKKNQSNDGIKVYKRLIPADVLRGILIDTWVLILN